MYFVAKRIVREFAHLRWGVFDEDVPVIDKESVGYYTSAGKLTPIR